MSQAPRPNGGSRPNKRPRGGASRGPQKSTGASFNSGTASVSHATPIDTPVVLTPRGPTPAPQESSRGFTTTRFTDFLTRGQMSQPTADGIAALRPVHEFCTPVQEATLPVILTGVDVLAQAKTGTGKTLAFLIPSVENLLRAKPAPVAGQISVLIMSPTRELAIQIEENAQVILSATPFKVQHVVGGTNMKSETSRLNRERCDILVATPGRLQDHLENSNLRAKLANVKALILDEADRLLEQGFRREIEKIINMLPNRQQVPRQTLLFSATIPAQVHQVAALALLPSHKFITTISEADANTHLHVPQHLLTCQTLDELFPLALAAIRSEVATHGDATKIMCFLPTARATGLAAALFKRCNLGLDVLEIHSRKSQSQRNAAAETFKDARKAILFSSDVTARGMDFPGVTTVLQVGLPAAPEQYVHRLGRTARAGTDGSGILILTEFEKFFLRKREIVALPIKVHPNAQTSLSTSSPEFAQAQQQVAQAILTVDDDTKAQFYSASLGFYKAFLGSTFGNADAMVAAFNAYAISPRGLAYKGASGEIPEIMTSTIGKMGLKGTKGLNLVKELSGKEGRGGGGGRGPGGGRGGGGGGAPRGRGGSNNVPGGDRFGGGIPGAAPGSGRGGAGGGRGGGAGRGGARGGRGRGGF